MISAKNVLDAVGDLTSVNEGIGELKNQALLSSRALGHDIGIWNDKSTLVRNGRSYRSSSSKCKKCGALVFVNAGPTPDSNEVRGPAIKSKCR